MKIATLLLFGVCLIASPLSSFALSDTLDVNNEMNEMFTFAVQHPYMHLYGGLAMLSLDGVSAINDDITFGGDFGFEATKQVRSSSVNHAYTNGLYLTYHMAPDATTDAYTIQTWRFGARTGESYGYQFQSEKEPGVYFCFDRAPLSWYSINVEGQLSDPTQTARLTYFEDALRFGESSTASIRLRATEAVSLHVGFEWAQAYERHMFWYWAGSGIIEGVADGLASFFVKAIGKNSPGAIPIMHFILRNGVAMGFKALRQNQMNWPFTTAAPLNYMTYQVGVSVVF